MQRESSFAASARGKGVGHLLPGPLGRRSAVHAARRSVHDCFMPLRDGWQAVKMCVISDLYDKAYARNAMVASGTLIGFKASFGLVGENDPAMEPLESTPVHQRRFAANIAALDVLHPSSQDKAQTLMDT